ncbi:MAG: NAD(P)-dependent oxidoreductase [Hyphomicrobiales bacterium]|nr:NAD(P)-dependent oxidoreductase [Hyphomicrobiales bacterium]
MSGDEPTTVLITGANGCIGSWALKCALERGWRPIASDIAAEPTRPHLLLDQATLAGIPWIQADIADTDAVNQVFSEHAIDAVVHLGALQVPFCKADPVAGARVNVVGTANIMEAVRANGIQRFSFASSVAIQGTADAKNPYLGTLYGAYKSANEEMGRVYWQDWQVPSIVLRPGLVYGVARDQGMTSATTKAILAAVAGRPYTVPFSGAIGLLYTREVANAFLEGAARNYRGCHVFDINGINTPMETFLDLIRAEVPGADISAAGDPLPFPAELSDEPVRALLGDYGLTSVADGVSETIAQFRPLLDRDLIDLSQLDR